MEKKMLTEVFYLHEKGSLADARLCTYILDDSDSIAIEKRPMMLICPGGGYEHTSDPVSYTHLNHGACTVGFGPHN